MKVCPDTKHYFVVHDSNPLWSAPTIFCRNCGLLGPFELRKRA